MCATITEDGSTPNVLRKYDFDLKKLNHLLKIEHIYIHLRVYMRDFPNDFGPLNNKNHHVSKVPSRQNR